MLSMKAGKNQLKEREREQVDCCTYPIIFLYTEGNLEI